MALDFNTMAGLLPGGAGFNRILGDVADIANVLMGGAQAPQQARPAVQADAFQPAAAPQQQAALAGTPGDFGKTIDTIMQTLNQIVGLLGQLAGKGGAPAG